MTPTQNFTEAGSGSLGKSGLPPDAVAGSTATEPCLGDALMELLHWLARFIAAVVCVCAALLTLFGAFWLTSLDGVAAGFAVGVAVGAAVVALWAAVRFWRDAK